MPNLNKVIIAGHLGRDPETRFTPKGLCIASISLAISRKWKAEGEEKQETTWVEVDAFGKTAEVMAQHLRKGSPVLIEGRLKLDEWEDKQTHQKRNKLKVICESFQFLGGERKPTAAAATGASPAVEPDVSDDVPF